MEREDRIEQRLLLEDGIPLRNGSCGLYTGDGSVNFRGQPVSKSNSGNWRACIFILGTECCERLAFYGIAMNLVTYLTQNLHEGNVAAARNVSIWGGTCSLTPLFGAVLADAYWGRYWTIAAFSTFYFLGMCALTLSATVPYFKPAECVGSLCPPATTTQYTIFFFGLYLISLGTGGIKPCVSSFGADQFDDTDPIERVKKQSFFNWFYFTINIGALLSSTLIVWIQDNIGWGIGFVIPALFMGIAVVSFFSGTSLYRFQPPGGSPLTKVCQVLVASIKKWKLDVPADGNLLYETPDKISAVEGSKKLEHTNDLRWITLLLMSSTVYQLIINVFTSAIHLLGQCAHKFLDKASVVFYHEGKNGDSIDPWILCTVTQVEELKILIRMFPIWATGIVFSSVFSQMGTMFLEQGLVMDRKVGPFTIPAASLSAFDVISVILWVPLYDWALVPIACKFTGNERGFSQLQRMGIGLFISIFSMLAAALVETKRLEIARSLELDENVYVPLNILWQMPQYSLIGCAEVFTYIGQLEFFYDQSPDAMRSLCSAFALLTSSLGSYLNSFIITVVSSTGWLPDNLNKGHLDYYFCFLAGLSFLNLVVYVTCAKMYKQKKTFR